MLQRKTVLAMSMQSRLGKHSPFYLLDQYVTTPIIDLSLNDDPYLAPPENYSSLPHRFAALYAADWDDV
jgi:hypothetical protein